MAPLAATMANNFPDGNEEDDDDIAPEEAGPSGGAGGSGGSAAAAVPINAEWFQTFKAYSTPARIHFVLAAAHARLEHDGLSHCSILNCHIKSVVWAGRQSPQPRLAVNLHSHGDSLLNKLWIVDACVGCSKCQHSHISCAEHPSR